MVIIKRMIDQLSQVLNTLTSMQHFYSIFGPRPSPIFLEAHVCAAVIGTDGGAEARERASRNCQPHLP